jgi:hypothetical protein
MIAIRPQGKRVSQASGEKSADKLLPANWPGNAGCEFISNGIQNL